MMPVTCPDTRLYQKAGVRFDHFYSNNEKCKHLFRDIRLAATGPFNILLLGETGTGKNHIAQSIHAASPFHEGPFRDANLSGVSASLLESHLFGHEKGAFTGASERSEGILASVNSGTLFLDELSTLPLELQSRLLRLIEESTFHPVGGKRTCFEGRIVAATNRPRAELIERPDRFRADLYFRLEELEFELMALRDRKEDIEDLFARHLLAACERLERPVLTYTPAVTAALLAYAWPGNLREVRNLARRLAQLCRRTEVDVDDLPRHLFRRVELPIGEGQSMTEVRKRHVLSVVEATCGNVGRASSILGMAATTVYRLLKRYRAKR